MIPEPVACQTNHMISLLAAIAILSPQDDPKMGLKDKQILELGFSRFVNRFSVKFGSSTAAMVDACETYGDAIKRLNDNHLKSKPQSLTFTVAKLRALMKSFRNELCDIGRAFSGGGTIWNISYSETNAYVEESIAAMIGVRQTKAPKMVTSEVTATLDKVAKVSEDNKEDIESYKDSGGGMEEVNESLAKARKNFTGIANVLKTMPRTQSDTILGFCKQAAQIPLNQFESP